MLPFKKDAAMSDNSPLRVSRWAFQGSLLAAFLLTAPMSATANTASDDAAWNPVASERLVRLPGAYLKRAVDNDFAGSSLAAEIRDTENLIGLKGQTLADLQNASEQAEGELKVELQHQFLAQKRDYLELMGHQQSLRRKQLATKQRLFERLIGKLDSEQQALTPQRQALVEKQSEARKRMESSISTVDLQIFNSPVTSESKYAREYSKNMAAIERLVAAVQSHPMNSGNEVDGQPVTKRAYLRQLVAETEAELQVIDQEETILGYMAKLVALDALALSDLLAGGPVAEDSVEPEEETGISAAVDYFIAQ